MGALVAVGAITLASVAAAWPAAATATTPATPSVAGEVDSAAAARSDPASDRLRYVIGGLVALSGVLLVGTARFWWTTRPALVGPPTGRGEGGRRSAARSDAAGRIPASVVLAGPLTAPPIIPVDADLDDIPPPVGAPVMLAPPAQVDDAPSTAESTDDRSADDRSTDDLAADGRRTEHPLVGADSAWIIGDDPASSVRTPEPETFASASVVSPSAAGGAAAAPATSSLIAALAALPDHDGPRVEFDDPPVQRVTQARTAPEPAAQPEPEPEADPEPQVESVAASEPVVELPRDEPALELVDLPPVGVFYDQDLDPGDPPGRDAR